MKKTDFRTWRLWSIQCATLVFPCPMVIPSMAHQLWISSTKQNLLRLVYVILVHNHEVDISQEVGHSTIHQFRFRLPLFVAYGQQQQKK